MLVGEKSLGKIESLLDLDHVTAEHVEFLIDSRIELGGRQRLLAVPDPLGQGAADRRERQQHCRASTEYEDDREDVLHRPPPKSGCDGGPTEKKTGMFQPETGGPRQPGATR